LFLHVSCKFGLFLLEIWQFWGKEIPQTPLTKFAHDFVLRPWFKKIAKRRYNPTILEVLYYFNKYEIFSEYTKEFLKILYKIGNLPQAPTCPGKTNAIFMV
jgi:hypothetical protein